MRLYPIARPESGSAPEDSVDFQGSFRIGFNAEEQILYLAVEVQDESTVIDTTDGEPAPVRMANRANNERY